MNSQANNDENLSFSCETTMESNEVFFLISKLKKSKNYLEYGSGFSTIQACKYVKKKILSVETNKEYIDYIDKKIKSENLDSTKITFLYSDIGVTREWGYPANSEEIKQWPNYAINEFQDRDLRLPNPDLCLIDGRFRVATFAWLYLTSPGLQIIFDDYFDRPQYHIVESFIKPKERAGRIALFRIPRFRPTKKLNMGVKVLMNNILNPD
jgi:hypothetical protein